MYNRDKRKRLLRFFPLIILIGVLLSGLVVMLLWNAILPTAIHAGTLTYLQATGLLVLCRLLFGGFGRRFGPGRRGAAGGREKWMNMSDEEKNRFREEWKRRCGPK